MNQFEPEHDTFNGFEIVDLDEAVARVEPALVALAGESLFVTGGTGFIGQWLLSVLARANGTRQLGITATVLTRCVETIAGRCPQLAAESWIDWIQGDVCTFDFPKGRFTHVIHAATDTSVAADRQPLTLIDTIVGGTRRALDFSLAVGARRFLLLSSGAAYGSLPADMTAVPEEYTGSPATTDPRSTYGQAKRLAEQLGTIFCAAHGLEVVIGRLFAFVGPGMPLDAHFAIGNFIRDAVAGREAILSGDGTPLRSYLYAADLAAWLLRLLTEGRAGAVYNVGSDQCHSVAEIAARVAAVVPGAAGFAVKGTPQPGAARSRYIPAVDKARSELGLEVWTPLDEAILRTARWARRARASDADRVTPAMLGGGDRKKLTFVVDVDGVLASLTAGNNYELSTPLTGTIAQVNLLYDAGHNIILYTARGSATGIDWTTTTRRQLSEWGVKYHELRFGKPAADFYVDDRALSPAGLRHIVDVSG